MILENIKNKFPEASIEEGALLTITVETGRYRELALYLKNDGGLAFDFLICMTGMDWEYTKPAVLSWKH